MGWDWNFLPLTFPHCRLLACSLWETAAPTLSVPCPLPSPTLSSLLRPWFVFADPGGLPPSLPLWVDLPHLRMSISFLSTFPTNFHNTHYTHLPISSWGVRLSFLSPLPFSLYKGVSLLGREFCACHVRLDRCWLVAGPAIHLTLPYTYGRDGTLYSYPQPLNLCLYGTDGRADGGRKASLLQCICADLLLPGQHECHTLPLSRRPHTPSLCLPYSLLPTNSPFPACLPVLSTGGGDTSGVCVPGATTTLLSPAQLYMPAKHLLTFLFTYLHGLPTSSFSLIFLSPTAYPSPKTFPPLQLLCPTFPLRPDRTPADSFSPFL